MKFYNSFYKGLLAVFSFGLLSPNIQNAKQDTQRYWRKTANYINKSFYEQAQSTKR